MTASSASPPSIDMLIKSAAFLGSTGVAAGAFGAHALKEKLKKKQGAMENWRTAVMYQLFHAAAILALSSLASSAMPMANNKDNGSFQLESQRYIQSGKYITAGTVLFSGSIYCLTLGLGPKMIMGPTTPIGGLFMIGGWATLAM
mmetsp:Transcript_27298/g.54612  ORF Transcript_27298/g.54612 Transcript_27298/m.54612 type:complete len:145 (-) Transcript_27298:163-597(-)